MATINLTYSDILYNIKTSSKSEKNMAMFMNNAISCIMSISNTFSSLPEIIICITEKITTML